MNQSILISRGMFLITICLQGVPPQAVKLKMQSEGLDPALLDTPNAPSPSVNAAAAPKREEDASDDNDDTDSDDSD